MQLTRSTATAIGAVLVLALAAGCGGSDGPPAKATSRHTSAPGATWSAVTLPAGQLQGRTSVSFDASLAAGPGGPAIIAGTRTPRGATTRVAMWPMPSGKPALLDLPGSASLVALLADGKRTTALGVSVQAGRKTNWVQTSTDRRSWRAAALPGPLKKADAALVGGVALGGGKTLLLVQDREQQLMAVPTSGGSLVTLPKPSGAGRYSGSVAIGSAGNTVLLLATVQEPNGRTVLAGLRSTDAGASWRATGAPSAPGATAYGIVRAGARFVATGYTSKSVAQPAAWSSTDGKKWTREPLPRLPRQDGSWSAYLSPPVADGGTTYAAGINTMTLSGTVLKRVGGAWRTTGVTSDWSTPGAETVVAPAKGYVGVGRFEDGRATIGRLSGGRFHAGSEIGLRQHAGNWGTPALFNGLPDVPFTRLVVHARPNSSWDTTTTSQVISIDGSKGTLRSPKPAAVRRLASLSVASDADGQTIEVGTDIHYDDTAGHSDDADLAGFSRGAKGGWIRITGLKGPRTEQLGSVYRLGRTWVALGYDRADFNSGAHEFGAIWTSTDGRTFQRQRGDFDVSPTQNSYFNGACGTAGGGLLVVGGVADPARGSVPTAFQRTGKKWTKLDLHALGGGLQDLSGCVSTGTVTLLQGRTGQGSGLWRSTDLKSWDKVTIGGRTDSVRDVRPVQGGFAAAGARYGGLVSQPVVWLSTDGRTWTSVDVPTTRDVSASDVVEWQQGDRHRLVVLLNGDGGPAVQTLTNLPDLLAYATKQQ